MKKMFFAIVFAAFCVSLVAQDSTQGWKKGGAAGLNFSQIGLRNWSGGGENSISMATLLSLFANMKRGKLSWDNSLDLGYGIVKQGKTGTRKSDDKIVFTSKFGREAVEHWSYSGLLDFRTQFARGFDYSANPKTKLSQFMAPGYLTLSLGGEYKPNDHFYALVSPVTGKATFVTNKALSDAGAFGVDSGKTVRPEFGWLINSKYKQTVMEGIDFESKLNLFASYKDLKHVDVNWENQLLMKVNKYVSSSVSAQMVYDNDIKDTDGKAKVQFKELIAVGLLYKF